MEEEKIQRIRCPCCDSIFEIKLAQIQFNRGKIILDKINSSTSPSATLEKPKETNSSFIQDCYNEFCPHHNSGNKCYQEDLRFCNSKLHSPK